MPMEKINRLIAAIIFVFTSIIYLMTVAPTLSFWDCGEFIATSYKLSVPHPPGSPLFLLVGRLFTLLPFGDVAFRVNMISVFSSSITIMLLYLIIVHLVRQWKGQLADKSDWLLAMFSGILGSLSFAFTHSFWFNAAEAEVYAASMLFTSLIVWLILVWATKSEEPGNEKYLLVIAYLIGLAIAVHLLNVLALPFVAMVFYYKKFAVNVKSFLIMTLVTGVLMIGVYPGMVKWVPRLALNFGTFGLAAFFIIIIGAAMWAINNHKHILTLVFVSMVLISVGYSTYATVYIRSNLNPTIDENNPENIENFISYIEREQYGTHSSLDRRGVWKSSPNGKRYSSPMDFFWTYQVKQMYIRYFAWQFIGMDDDETSVNFKQLFALPFLLGMIGIWWHFRRDPRHALAVLALFFMTGLAIILYLNQPDPQPRERDYSYVGSFFAFSIWIGLGYAGILEMVRDYFRKSSKKFSHMLYYAVFLILLLAVPVNMLARNFESHNRSGNYVAWDYSYNMLMSCAPNGILFTNGDNDTFPLWYLQEVEGIRTDVRIVNLSLLNTDWYIQQLRDLEPKVPIRMSDAEISQVGIRPWKTQKRTLKVPKEVALEARKEYQSSFNYQNIGLPEKIEFEVRPAMKSAYGGFLRTQDWMVLHIIAANRWKRPIYFAVTVPRSNMLSELYQYMRMDGLVYRLVPYKNWIISPKELEKNLMDVYKYRNLNNPDVYYNSNIKNLLQNYRSGFIQLSEYYARQNEFEKLKAILQRMDEVISPQVIPWNNRSMRLVTDAFYIVADSNWVDTLLTNPQRIGDLPTIGEHLLRLRRPQRAIMVLEKVYNEMPSDQRLVYLLVNAYEMAGQTDKSIARLQEWLQANPNDQNMRRFLQSIKARSEKN